MARFKKNQQKQTNQKCTKIYLMKAFFFFYLYLLVIMFFEILSNTDTEKKST